MRTEKEIRKRLEEVESDERLSYDTATIETNAVLALIQCSLEAERDTLRWVLEDIPIPISLPTVENQSQIRKWEEI